MPDVSLPTWLNVLLIGGVVATALLSIVKAWTGVIVPYLVRPIHRAVERAMESIVEDLVEDHLKPMKHELVTNGGSSLKDAVLRIERRLEAESEGRREHEEYVHERFAMFGNFLTMNDPQAKADIEELLSES